MQINAKIKGEFIAVASKNKQESVLSCVKRGGKMHQKEGKQVESIQTFLLLRNGSLEFQNFNTPTPTKWGWHANNPLSVYFHATIQPSNTLLKLKMVFSFFHWHIDSIYLQLEFIVGNFSNFSNFSLEPFSLFVLQMVK